MFNLLLTLIIGVIVGWNFHAFFIQLDQPHILDTDISFATSSAIDGTSIPSYNSKEIAEHNNSITTLLKNNLFEKALLSYQETNSTLQPIYYNKILEHLTNIYIESPHKAVKHIEEFQRLNPNDTTLTSLLLASYEKTETYSKAIKIVTKKIETASAEKVDLLETKLLKLSTDYINKLKKKQNSEKLISFLKQHIELGIQTPFYLYSLAEHYFQVKNHLEATPLLKEIEFDYDYGQQAKELLGKIQNENLNESEYTHQLPLNKFGEHYTIDVSVNEVPLKLLLDTGATLTMIHEDKLPILTTINDNIILNTAGGEITAELKEVERFSTGDIELKKFKIVSGKFEDEHSDGLLGMNFFKQFNFQIDQENTLLNLSKKE